MSTSFLLDCLSFRDYLSFSWLPAEQSADLSLLRSETGWLEAVLGFAQKVESGEDSLPLVPEGGGLPLQPPVPCSFEFHSYGETVIKCPARHDQSEGAERRQ